MSCDATIPSHLFEVQNEFIMVNKYFYIKSLLNTLSDYSKRMSQL